jgi:uncharacterized phosphatase
MTITKLGLLRHGQTDWNIDLRLQGTTDIPMNQTGISQVQQAAKVLAGHSFDLILTSPLERAVHTAKLVQEALSDIEIAIEPLLLERSFGVGEGFTYQQWQEQYESLEHIPGAEPRKTIEARAQVLLKTLLERHAGANILAVSHGALIRFVLAEVTQGMVPPPGQRLQNASLHVLRHESDWMLEAWSPEPLGELQ